MITICGGKATMLKKYKDKLYTWIDDGWVDLEEWIRERVRDEFKKLSQDSNATTYNNVPVH